MTNNPGDAMSGEMYVEARIAGPAQTKTFRFPADTETMFLGLPTEEISALGPDYPNCHSRGKSGQTSLLGRRGAQW